MSSPPLISVLMPVYNVARFLPAAIDSILGQTLADFELLLVDDGSTDATPDIVAEYARRDPRVRALRRPHEGIVAALNYAVAESRGTLLARMDGDDLSMPERFERQVAFLRGHNDHVAVGSRALLTDEDGAPICVKNDTLLTHEEIDAAMLANGWPIIHATVVMRAPAVRAAGGYRERFTWLEDLDLFLRLADLGRLANLPEVLYHYRQNFASVCWTHQADQLRVRAELYRDTRRRRGLPSDDRREGDPPRAVYEGPELHRLWAWWALAEGNVRTARKHALRSMRGAPLSLDSWRVLACAVRGY